MTVEALIDTNVLVYAVSNGRDDRAKRDIANKLIADLAFATSAQVLQEFYVTVTRKIVIRMGHGEAMDWIEEFEQFPCVPIDLSLVRSGAANANRHQISYWDGAILAAAERLGAPILYTEDLNHGQQYGSVTALNPFRSA